MYQQIVIDKAPVMVLNVPTLNEGLEMSDQQTKELQNLKAHFPFRIVYGALRNGEWQAGAVTSKRIPNQLARKGWQVWLLS
jgi:hypothetical protein